MSYPSTVKAIGITNYGDIDALQELQLPFPTVKDNEILIKVEYAGVNFIDTYKRSGLYPAKSLPLVLGEEAVGRIAQLPTSPEVLADEQYKLGNLTIGEKVGVILEDGGAFQDYISVPWTKVTRIPEEIDSKTAGAVVFQGMTALANATDAHYISKGETVLIYSAAGGVGTSLVQIALGRGATVIAVVSSDSKAALVKSLGAQHVIVTKYQNTIDEALKITGGKGVNAIFDGVGKDTHEDNFKIIARKGSIVTYGNASGVAPPVPPLKLMEKNVRFLRTKIFTYIDNPEDSRGYSDELFSLVAKGVFHPQIHGEYPFSAVGMQQAEKDITGRGTMGKLLIKVA